MTYGHAVLVVLIGAIVIVPPITLNGRPGSRYGIPFPVLARAAFGMRGAQVPAMMRALVACGWYGILCYIGGESLFEITLIWAPGIGQLAYGHMLMFFIFWVANLAVLWWGVEGLRRLLLIKVRRSHTCRGGP